MATNEDRARWAREYRERKRLGLPQAGRGDGLRKYDHSGPTYRTRPAEYRTWSSMKVRCSDSSFKDWHLYGGRGIAVCARWADSFENFFNDVGPRPSTGYSLDRFPNGDGNYEPGNVRWATAKEQRRNTSAVRLICHRGESLILTDWAARIGINSASLLERIAKWGVEKALSYPPIRIRKRTRFGTYAATVSL